MKHVGWRKRREGGALILFAALLWRFWFGKREAERVPRLAGALCLQLLLVMRLHLWMRQVREMCSGGNRDGVQGGLGHWRLWTSWRTLRGHQHHWGVGGWRVVRWDDTGLHMGLLHMCHMVGVVAMLHLLSVNVDRLLSRGERRLGRLRVRRHGGGRRGQGRVNLLLWGGVGQMESLGCCRRCCCCLLVLRMLDWAGCRVAWRAAMLRRAALLGLASRGGRGLGVLRVRV